MAREKFVDSYLEKLIDKDKDISERIEQAETDREKELLRTTLKDSLGHSYDTYAKEYFDSKGVGSYLSSFLRYGGLATDVLGTYTFWSLGPAGVHITAPAAAGFKGAALAGKGLADLIDGHHYAKYAKTKGIGDKVVDSTKIIGEGLVERAIAYTPFTFGVAELTDLVRGKSKYDAKVTARALQYAKSNFLEKISTLPEAKPQDNELNIVSLDKFKHPEYAREEHSLAA